MAKKDSKGKWIKLTYEFVKSIFEENNCQLLSQEYVNARTHLEYICSCGNRSKVIFDSFRRGHRCGRCGIDKCAKSQKLTFEEVRLIFSTAGCELLENSYINAQSILRFRCKCGNTSSISLNNFQSRKRCADCGVRQRSGEKHYQWKKDRELHAQDNVFRQRAYKIVRHSLMLMNRKKTAKTHNLLGYKYTDLRNHMTSHPNWERVKDEDWQTDHIFPVKAFIDYGIFDLRNGSGKAQVL